MIITTDRQEFEFIPRDKPESSRVFHLYDFYSLSEEKVGADVIANDSVVESFVKFSPDGKYVVLQVPEHRIQLVIQLSAGSCNALNHIAAGKFSLSK